MTTKEWTTTFFYKGKELGRGVWDFNSINRAPDTNSTFVDSDISVLDLSGSVFGHQYVSLSNVGA